MASSGQTLDNSGATTNGGTVHQKPVVAGNPNQEWQLIPAQIGANTPFTCYEAESGANVVPRQALSVNPRRTWVYENASDYNGMSKAPFYGSLHVFWDERSLLQRVQCGDHVDCRHAFASAVELSK